MDQTRRVGTSWGQTAKGEGTICLVTPFHTHTIIIVTATMIINYTQLRTVVAVEEDRHVGPHKNTLDRL